MPRRHGRSKDASWRGSTTRPGMRRRSFLVGDIFDFWFEYRRVVPKGFVRTLGKLAELTDRGVRVVFFTGNHDMWVGDYLTRECGLEIPHLAPEVMTLSGERSSSPTATT